MRLTNKTILCVWEIGGDLGHLMRLAKITRRLNSDGFKVVLVLRDLARVHTAFAELDVALYQAPVWLPKMQMQRPIACLADTLLLMGYLEAQALNSLVRAWRSLFAQVRPACVIYDYAPTALLASMDLPVPKIIKGSGFADPVPGAPIADWRPYPAADGLVARQEARVLASVNAVLRGTNQAPLDCLTNLFRADARIITAYEFMDPYSAMRAPEEYCVSLEDAAVAQPIRFAGNGKANVLTYVKNTHPKFREILQGLAGFDANLVVVSPNAPRDLLASLTRKNALFTDQLVNFPAALAQADLLVGHGNGNTVTEAIGSGVPCLVMPEQLEQLLIGQKLEAAGAGSLLAEINEAELHLSLNKLLEPGYRLAAEAVRDQSVACVEPLAERVSRLIGQWL